jgi:hypothetical protein
MVVIDKKVCDEHHRLDGSYGSSAQVRAHTQRLVTGGRIEFGCLLSLPGRGRRHKLGAQRQHYKHQGHKSGIRSILLGPGQRPEVLVVGIEGLPMEHGIYRVDALEVAVEQNIGLQLVRKYRYYLWQSALASPVVGEWMFRSDAENIRRSRGGIGDIGQQTGGGGNRAQSFEPFHVEATVSSVWHDMPCRLWPLPGRSSHPAAICCASPRLSGFHVNHSMASAALFSTYSRRLATWAYLQSV